MSNTIKVGEFKPTVSVDEFDALLEAYKKSNPVKFALKEKSGEFERFRAKLSSSPLKVEEPVKVEEVAKPVIEEPVIEKPKVSKSKK